MEFSIELAQQLIDVDEQFPVNFEDAWQWCGYTRKDAAKEKLTRNFERGADFCTIWRSEARSGGSGGFKQETIFLTIDCFKMFAMMAGTEKGRQIRQYFLECERIAKNSTSLLTGLSRLEILEMALDSEKKALAAEGKLKEVEPRLEAYSAFIESKSEFTLTETVKALNTTARKLCQVLREYGVLFQRTDKVLPRSTYIDKGWFEVHEVECEDGCFRTVTKVTPVGQEQIAKLWSKENREL